MVQACRSPETTGREMHQRCRVQTHKKWFLNELKTVFIFTFQKQKMICVNNLHRGCRVSRV